MTILATLLAELRNELDDNALVESDQLWSDPELVVNLNEGAGELCRAARLFKDSTNVLEVLATGTIALSGSAGQVDGIKVNAVEITSAAVPFNTSLAQTAIDLAANINAFTSVPNYTATPSGNTVIIKAVAGTGSNPNGYAVVPTASGGMAGTSTVMAGGGSLCELYLIPGKAKYALDPRIFEVLRVKPALRQPLAKATEDEIDEAVTAWQDATGLPTIFIADMDEMMLTVYPTPEDAETVNLTVLRVQLAPMSVTAMSAALEFNDMQVPALKDYAKYLAYSKNDAETLRGQAASCFASFSMKIEKLLRERLRTKGSPRQLKPNKGFM